MKERLILESNALSEKEKEYDECTAGTGEGTDKGPINLTVYSYTLRKTDTFRIKRLKR
jgi:hypothetical protein